MRAFVAVFPPPDVQDALIEAARALPGFRLTAPERVHLTLRFLGDVPPGPLSRVAGALDGIGDGWETLDLAVSGFGAFPSTRRARVLWAGIGAGSERLRDLARAVEARLEPVGFAREDRPFVPHMTLGRARKPVPLNPTDASLPRLRFEARSIDLVQSYNESSGVTYSTLATYQL